MMLLIKLVKSRWTYVYIHLLGYSLLGGYLFTITDLRISVVWALAFPVIMLSVALVVLRLHLRERYPKLNRYIFYSDQAEHTSVQLTHDARVLKKVNYALSGFRGTAILTAPAEDGMICVPILFIGINTFSAMLGGAIFSFIHLGRFTYLECISKGVGYTLISLIVLPHGLLTVILGHLITDGIAFATLQILRHKLSESL